MATFKLVPYFIRIKEKHSDKYLDLENIPKSTGGKITLNDVFNQFLSQYVKNIYLNDKERKTLFIDDVDTNGDFISGIIKTGEYGYETDFYDIIQKKHIPSAKREEHSEERPFFFLFHQPKLRNPDIGVLILQKFKQFGTKTMLEEVLNDILYNTNPKLSIEIHPIINNDLMKKLKSSRLIELRLIKRKIPKDIADKNLIENYEDVREERSFKVRWNRSISLKNIGARVEEALKNIEYPYTEVEKERYDEVKLVVKSGESEETITLGDFPEFAESMSLDEKKLQLEKGFPTKETLLPYAKRYINTILELYSENTLK